MPNPFDTGIRLTVVEPTEDRARCDVDEFVLCPTNARADEWQRLAETEARDHLATAKRLVESEVALAQAQRGQRKAEADTVARIVAWLRAECADSGGDASFWGRLWATDIAAGAWRGKEGA